MKIIIEAEPGEMDTVFARYKAWLARLRPIITMRSAETEAAKRPEAPDTLQEREGEMIARLAADPHTVLQFGYGSNEKGGYRRGFMMDSDTLNAKMEAAYKEGQGSLVRLESGALEIVQHFVKGPEYQMATRMMANAFAAAREAKHE